MTNWFNNPSLLWSALLILPLLALFMLRHRPVRRRVPSVLLWKGIAQMQVATSPFQRLRKSTSLLLLLLALLLMVLALAGFKVPSVKTDSTPAIVIIDTTASMAAGSGAGSRLELAVQVIPELESEGDLNIEKVLAWDGQIRNITGRTLSELSTVDYGANASVLRQNLKSIVRENPDRKVILISDSPMDGIEGLTVLGVGRKGLNAAITTASVQEISPTQTDLFFGLELFHARDYEITLLVERWNKGSFEVVDSSRLMLVQEKRTAYHLKDAQPGLYRATIKTQDTLSLDNAAWLRVSKLPVIDVVIHGDPGEAVTRATKAIEESMGIVRVVDRESASRAHLTTHLFADRATSGSQSLLPSVYFAPYALPQEVTCDIETDVSISPVQRIDHGLWKGVGQTEIGISKVCPISTQRWFEPLLTAGDKTVLALMKKTDSPLSDLLVMTPTNSESTGFTETVAFLVFWANWYDYVRRCTDPMQNGATKTHQSSTLWTPGQTATITVTHSQSDSSFEILANQLFTPERVGLYEGKGLHGPEPLAFGASLLDSAESSLPVPDDTDHAAELGAMADMESEYEEDFHLAQWLLLLACGIFIAEWLLYRRKFQIQTEDVTHPKHEEKLHKSKATA
ncbi:MAG: BatA domain-containing protein [Planctomycetota bacterium]|jgi:hypothetical protein